MLSGRKILIGITGSIAAYKIPFLIRMLKKEGAEVKVILTDPARDFVTPLTLSTLSDNPVLSEFFNSDDGTWNSHVELGHWADLFLVAPASANTMAKMAGGMADNLLVATYLACRCPVMIAPAMDVDMLQHPATRENIEKLKKRGHQIIDPGEGDLASGLKGPGRLKEPSEIFEVIRDLFQKKKDFADLKVLVTAGPTQEAIDPVRYLGNRSSGKMGYALASEFSERGAGVILISGPVHLEPPAGVQTHHVTSAGDMHNKVMECLSDADIVVMAAAVADFTPAQYSRDKIKKDQAALSLSLQKTVDILSEISKEKRKGQIVIGFALETGNDIENAVKKIREKKLDLIVLNSLRDQGAGFGFNTNKITIIGRTGDKKEYGLKSKKEVAADIADEAIKLMS